MLGVLSSFKKSENPKKNFEVGGWANPQFFLCFVVCFCVSFCFEHVSKNWLGWWVGSILANPFFSRIFRFF